MANTVPREVKKEIVDGWIAETWYVCLLTSTFPWVDDGTYLTYDDLTNEVVGVGYTEKGEPVDVLPWAAYVTTTDAMIDANDTAWTTATFANVKYAVIYETTSNKIRAVYEFTAAKSVTSGTFTIQWNFGGLVGIS